MKVTNISQQYWKEKTDFLFGMMFCVAALYHFLGIFFKVNEASVLRHATFAVIDLYCLYGFLYRHSLFNLFFSVLTAHQLFTHGLYLFTLWNLEQEIHWISLAVLILMPIGMAKLVIEYFTD